MIDQFFVWPISVRRKLDRTATAPVFAAADDSPRAKVRVENRVVVDADGREVVASVTLQMSADTERFPEGSEVTLPARFGGRTVRVVAEGLHDSGLSALPRYYEVNLA